MAESLTNKQKQSLLRVARRVVESAVRGEPIGVFESEDELFNEKRGCFVTIHNQGQLRGCIGQFEPDQALIKTVRDMAAAATRDSRFVYHPITVGELSEIDIEISVLSRLELTDDPAGLTAGEHGIYIKQGQMSGCYLPQVATETGWSVEELLSHCCSDKAGLAGDAWKSEDTQVFLFTADVFSEKEILEE